MAIGQVNNNTSTNPPVYITQNIHRQNTTASLAKQMPSQTSPIQLNIQPVSTPQFNFDFSNNSKNNKSDNYTWHFFLAGAVALGGLFTALIFSNKENNNSQENINNSNKITSQEQSSFYKSLATEQSQQLLESAQNIRLALNNFLPKKLVINKPVNTSILSNDPEDIALFQNVGISSSETFFIKNKEQIIAIRTLTAELRVLANYFGELANTIKHSPLLLATPKELAPEKLLGNNGELLRIANREYHKLFPVK